MSPAAYKEGEYPHEREVTTVKGKKVRVPYEPKREAIGEYVHAYGPIPKAGAPEEEKIAYRKKLAEIEEGIKEGTWTPVLERSCQLWLPLRM